MFPPALPLEPLPDVVLAATGMLAHPLIVAAVGFAILALALALLAAWSYSRSALGAPRYRREARGGEPSTPEVSGSPFPNLLRK